MAFKQKDWNLLVSNIKDGRVVPIVSERLSLPGMAYREFVAALDDELEYPVGGNASLPRLSQYSYVTEPKEEAARQYFLTSFREALDYPAAQTARADAMAHLAALRLPAYVTSSYFEYLEEALAANKADPRPEICYWHEGLAPADDVMTSPELRQYLSKWLDDQFSLDELRDLALGVGIQYDDLEDADKATGSSTARELVSYLARRGRLPELKEKARSARPNVDFDPTMEFRLMGGKTADLGKADRIPSNFSGNPPYRPSRDQPLVYHMFGLHRYPSSLVLAEDDFIDFLVNVGADRKARLANVRGLLSENSLLLIGFRLDDWAFKALFRGVLTQLDRQVGDMNVAIQLDPKEEVDRFKNPENAKAYFEKYFEKRGFYVCWREADKFLGQLATDVGDGT